MWVSCLNLYQHSCFQSSLSYQFPCPHFQCHPPTLILEALRLPGEKRCGRLKDGSVSNRMPALFYAYKAVTLPLRPQNSKSSLPSPSDVSLRRRVGA